MSFHDDDRGALDIVLGQTHHLLGEDGDVHAQRLVRAATLRLQRDGGIYHPMPGDNWDEPSYETVLCVDPNLAPEFTPEVPGRIWAKLEPVLRGRHRTDVFGVVVVVVVNVPLLPEVGEDWPAHAAQAAAAAPTNQARRERRTDGGHPQRDGLVLASRAEAAVYDTRSLRCSGPARVTRRSPSRRCRE